MCVRIVYFCLGLSALRYIKTPKKKERKNYIFNAAGGRAELEIRISNLTGTYDCCQMCPPLQRLPGCGLLWGWGAPAPPGYSDLLTAAHDPFPPAPLGCLALVCLHQDFAEIEWSAIQEMC